MFISSQLGPATAHDLVLRPSDPTFARSGLKVASLFRVGKVATISEALIVGTLGVLEAGLVAQLVERLTRMLRNV